MRDGEIGENEVNLEDLVILVNLVNDQISAELELVFVDF
jgi:hypothetical protein